jgi:hypothetical protein
MKKILLTLMVLWLASNLNAYAPKSLLDAIEATAEAREILIKDLQDADLGGTVRKYASYQPTYHFAAEFAEMGG